MVRLGAEGVHARHAGRDVLHGVDLQVGPGELWGIVGPNGAGKSTFLKVLLGLHPSTGGRVTLGGEPLEGMSTRERAKRLAWVPQSFDAQVGFTGLELVLLGRSPHLGALALPAEADVKRAEDTLAELGLSTLATRRTDALSGGELRLLLLARALVQSPEVLLLDEPTAFLDLRHQVRSLEAVRRRVREGLSAVAVLHDVNLAAAFADRVLLMRSGRVLAAGRPEEVLTPERLEALFEVKMRHARTVDGAPLFAPGSGT